jgi:hypothetical protein
MHAHHQFDSFASDVVRHEIVRILATGLVRLGIKTALASNPGFQSIDKKENGNQGLELSDETVLSVSRGVNGPENSRFSRSTAC